MTDGSELRVPDDVGNPLWHLVRRFARPHALRYVVAAVCTLLAQVPHQVPAFVAGVALDGIFFDTTPYTIPFVPSGWVPTETGAQVRFTVVLLAGAYLAEAVANVVAGRFAGTARLRTLHDVRVAAFEAVAGHDVSFFDDRQTGDVMSVLNNDVGNLRGFGDNAFRGLFFLAQLAVAFAFMLTLHVRLAALLLVFPVALAALSHWYTSRVGPVYERVRESVARVNSRLEDSVDGVTTVKSFAREDAERDAVAATSRAYRDTNWESIRLRLAFDLGSWTVSSFAFIGLFALGAYVVLEGAPPVLGESLTAGALLTFLLYSKSFYAPVRQLMLDVLDSYEDALASSKRVVAVLERERPDADEGDELHVSEGAVEYDDVSFTYPDAEERTLSNVSFTVEPGSLVGVVGPTGAGKSTMTKLLFRFYDPDEGTIRVDGTDVAGVSRRSLRDHLGYVSQDPFLFYGTVRENVAYGVDDADDGAVERVARLAGAHEFVTSLENGYDTQVGERGESLSGGQRQRIALARALLSDPAVLVLDEATSHVDNETERQIQRSIAGLAGERTTIAIAHRLSTVRNADEILVVDDGELVERGAHEELVAADGLYADLWRIQLGDADAVSDSFLADGTESDGDDGRRQPVRPIDAEGPR